MLHLSQDSGRGSNMSLIGSVTSLSAIHREAPRSTAAFADACQRVERGGKRASGFWECKAARWHLPCSVIT